MAVDYLQPKNGPVIRDLEACEIVYAKTQEQYAPLRTLRSATRDGAVLSRWQLSPEQRQAIADGADLFLVLLTFGDPLQPITLFVANDDDGPQILAEQIGGAVIA